MKKSANNRLQNVIAKDKCNNINIMSEVIRSDIFYLLLNYFEINFEDVICDIDNDSNQYIVNINAKAIRTKFPHKRLSS